MQFPSSKIDSNRIAQEAGSPRFCNHLEQKLRKKIDKTGKPRLYNQCLLCGAPVGNRVSAKKYDPAQIEAVPLFDKELRSNYWRAYNERYEAKRKQEVERLKRLWKNAYQKYLQTPEWIAKSKLVLLRAQGICEGCRSRHATQAHHTTYEHVGEEFLFELVALCRQCHERFHAWLLPRFLEHLYYSGYARDDGGEDAESNEDDASYF